jgi:nitrilase
MRVAVLQMVSSAQVETNLRRTEALIAEAKASQVDAIFLPENFSALGNDNPAAAAEVSAEVIRFLAESARNSGAWIFAGTTPSLERPDSTPVLSGRVRAASLVFDDEGGIVARYDKIHMFDVDVEDAHRAYRESNTFEHGESLELVSTPWAKVGLTVCYDIRFSEVYLALFKRGAEIFTVPSAFTVPTGQAHFETLMRARAIESFAFSIAACQGGSHDSGRETFGHSMVVNLWGEVLAQADTGEDVLVLDLDLREVHKARKNFPVLSQRRLNHLSV